MSRVLLVDDNSGSLGPLRALLADRNVDTLDAHDRLEALALGRMHSPRMLLAALSSAAMGDQRLLREWRVDATLKSIPFVVYSAVAVSPAEERRALDLGAAAFVTGPASASEILTRLLDGLPGVAGTDTVSSATAGSGGATPGPAMENSGNLTQSMEARLAELELANRELRTDNQRLSQLVELNGAKESDLTAANAELLAARRASLNLIEDAVEANQQLDKANRDLLREMTDRLRAEVHIRNLSQRLGLAVKGAGYGVWEYELATSLLVCDEVMYDLFGLVDAEVDRSYVPWLQCLHANDRENLARQYARLMAGETVEPFEFQIVGASDGALRCLEASGFLQPENEDGAACIIGILRDVTQRRDSEVQLRLLETCVAHLHDVVVITEAEPIDEPGPRIVFVNDAFERQTGYAREEVLGKSPRFLAGQKTERKELDRIRTALSKWKPVRAELLNLKKSGEEFWLELDITPVADAKGWFTHWVAVERDITERKKSELALQLSQQRLEDLINSTDGIVWEADARTLRFTYVSSRAERLLGYPCERWIEEPGFWEEHIHPDDRDAATRFCLDATARMQSHRLLYRMIAADGREVWLDDLINVVAEDGRPALLRGVMIDITERKAAEQILGDSQQRLKDLINSTDGIVWEVDPRTLQFIWASAHAERLLGFPSERWHLEPTFWADHLHPEDREEAVRLFQTCASTMQSGRLQFRMVAADGSVVWLENRLTVTVVAGELTAIRGVMIDITASKLAQHAMQESEERFRGVFDQSPMIIALLTLPDEHIVEMNDACLEAFGYSRDAIVGKSTVELGVWAHQEERERYIRHMQAEGSVRNMEAVMRRKNGELFTVFYNGNVIWIGGKPYSLNSMQDVTELKQSQRLQAALYAISEAAHDTADINDLYRRIHEIVGELLPARNFYVAIHDQASDLVSFPYFVDDFDPVPEPRKFGTGRLTERVLASGKSLLISPETQAEVVGEAVAIYGSDSIDWLGVPLKSSTRTFGVIVVQSYDGAVRYTGKDMALLEYISSQVATTIERKKGDEALIASERRFSMMFNGSADALFLLDDSLRFIDCNQATLDMLRYGDRDQLLSLGPLDISPVLQPDGQRSEDKVAEMIASARRHGSHRFEWIYQTPQRAPFPAEILLTQIFVDDHPWMLCTMRDITEHKRAQAALLQSNADLEQFAYSVSHDMRQPLRMVTGHLQLVERSLGDRLDGDDRANLGFALDGARRMDEMIVSLLDYSRVGRDASANAWIASRESLDEALAFLGPAIADSGTVVTTSGTWPRIFANRDEMTRLFQNLIGNASKFREKDQAPQIGIHAEVLAQRWRVCVSDNGIGIAPEQLGRLFQFFSRLQSRARFEGTGMGLALCRRIVEGHGGRIWAESAGEGQGSTFCFELPLNDPDDACANVPATQGQQE